MRPLALRDLTPDTAMDVYLSRVREVVPGLVEIEVAVPA